MYRAKCGSGEAMRSLPYATMHDVDRALRIGLVEEVCKPEDLHTVTNNFVRSAIKIPSMNLGSFQKLSHGGGEVDK